MFRIGSFLSVLLIFANTSFAQDTDTLNASHILIQHNESDRATGITRTKAEALEMATSLAKQAQAPGADFAAMAKKHSDGPSGPSGGKLGNFAPAQMVPVFSKATLGLKIGEVSGPVESPFGYHIIRRNPLVEDLSASHILIQFAGSERTKNQRSKEDALKLVAKLAQQAQAPNADFAKIAEAHSDCPSAAKGGDLGVFPPAQMIPEFSAATAKLEIGEVSEPVESAFGYHVILRQALPRKVSAKHILVQYKGSMRADATITRSKAEALTRIGECLAKLKAGEKFESLAKQYSDGPSGPNGGDLNEFGEGMMHPKFNDAVFALEVGGTTEAVETPFGFHLIYRYK